MASAIRKQRPRNTNVRKPIYLPEARAAANAVGQVLVTKYGQQAWLLQIMEMVQAAVDGAIKQLSGSAGPTQNAAGSLKAPEAYAMPARTREDVIQGTPNIEQVASDNPAPTNHRMVQEAVQAADAGDMDMFAQLAGVADPSTRQLGHGIPGQPAPQPMREAPVSASGLIMPNGAPAVVQPAPEPEPAKDWLM